MIARPVVVGLGRDTHLAPTDAGPEEAPTYCGRHWTAEAGERDDITCRQCRSAYAAGRHPKRRRSA